MVKPLTWWSSLAHHAHAAMSPVSCAWWERQLAFQRVAEWVPPRWPDPAYPQQLRLDIRVDDADRAERELRALGAIRVLGEHESGFRVFTDPVGHPFCIVFGGKNTR